MLLAGVKFDANALNQAEIEETRNKAMTTGRSFGGAPLRNGNGGHRGGRGGRINYADTRTPEQRPNPFAGYLPPGYIPPPNVAAANGFAPPVPQVAPPGYSQYPVPPPQFFNQYHSQQEHPSHGYNSGSYSQQGYHQQYQPPGPNYRDNGRSHESHRYSRGDNKPDRPFPEGYGYNRQ